LFTRSVQPSSWAGVIKASGAAPPELLARARDLFESSSRGSAAANSLSALVVAAEASDCRVGLIATALLYAYAFLEVEDMHPNALVDVRGASYRPVAAPALYRRTLPEVLAGQLPTGATLFIHDSLHTPQEVRALIAWASGIRAIPVAAAQAAVAAAPAANDPAYPHLHGEEGLDVPADLNADVPVPRAMADPACVAAPPADAADRYNNRDTMIDAAAALAAPVGGEVVLRCSRHSCEAAFANIVVITSSHLGRGLELEQPARVVADQAYYATVFNAGLPTTSEAVWRTLLNYVDLAGVFDQLMYCVGALGRCLPWHGHGLHNHNWRRAQPIVQLLPSFGYPGLVDPVSTEVRRVDTGADFDALYHVPARTMYWATALSYLQEGAALTAALPAFGVLNTTRGGSWEVPLRRDVGYTLARAVSFASAGTLCCIWHDVAGIGTMLNQPLRHHVSAWHATQQLGLPPGLYRPEVLDLIPAYKADWAKGLDAAYTVNKARSKMSIDGSPQFSGRFQLWYATLSRAERTALRVKCTFKARTSWHGIRDSVPGQRINALGAADAQQLWGRYETLFGPRGEALPSLQCLPWCAPNGCSVRYDIMIKSGLGPDSAEAGRTAIYRAERIAEFDVKKAARAKAVTWALEANNLADADNRLEMYDEFGPPIDTPFKLNDVVIPEIMSSPVVGATLNFGVAQLLNPPPGPPPGPGAVPLPAAGAAGGAPPAPPGVPPVVIDPAMLAAAVLAVQNAMAAQANLAAVPQNPAAAAAAAAAAALAANPGAPPPPNAPAGGAAAGAPAVQFNLPPLPNAPANQAPQQAQGGQAAQAQAGAAGGAGAAPNQAPAGGNAPVI